MRKTWFEMTHEERINEPGTMPDCPFCHKPRVQRSDYLRCNRCGVNWLEGEDVSLDPRKSRMPVTTPSKMGPSNSAQPAE